MVASPAEISLGESCFILLASTVVPVLVDAVSLMGPCVGVDDAVAEGGGDSIARGEDGFGDMRDTVVDNAAVACAEVGERGDACTTLRWVLERRF